MAKYGAEKMSADQIKRVHQNKYLRPNCKHSITHILIMTVCAFTITFVPIYKVMT